MILLVPGEIAYEALSSYDWARSSS